MERLVNEVALQPVDFTRTAVKLRTIIEIVNVNKGEDVLRACGD